MNHARQIFYTNFIDENSTDQGRLFQATKRLFARTDELSLPGTVARNLGTWFDTNLSLVTHIAKV